MSLVKRLTVQKSPKMFYTVPDSDIPTKAVSVAKNFEATHPADVPLGKDYYIDGRNTQFCQCQLGEDFKL
jgi:hypothetical protein